MGFKDRIGHQGWDLDLEAEIWPSRLGIRPRGWVCGLLARFEIEGGGTQEEKKKKKEELEKITHVRESIGHRSL